jgi:hypothetical protein
VAALKECSKREAKDKGDAPTPATAS